MILYRIDTISLEIGKNPQTLVAKSVTIASGDVAPLLRADPATTFKKFLFGGVMGEPEISTAEVSKLLKAPGNKEIFLKQMEDGLENSLRFRLNSLAVEFLADKMRGLCTLEGKSMEEEIKAPEYAISRGLMGRILQEDWRRNWDYHWMAAEDRQNRALDALGVPEKTFTEERRKVTTGRIFKKSHMEPVPVAHYIPTNDRIEMLVAGEY